jgi:hypothetical protein
MPTSELLPEFHRDYALLSEEQKREFRLAVKKLVVDLRRGQLRASLRIKAVQGNPGIFEMTWGGSGRATFDYGAPRQPGQPHVRWRRIGGHEIFKNP